MSPSITENLSSLSRSADQLNQLADRATEQIRAVDAYFSRMGLGITLMRESAGESICNGRERNSRGHMTEAHYFLGYGRDDEGALGLIVKAVGYATESGGHLVQISEACVPETLSVRRLERTSREIRIAAVTHLPALIEQLAKSAESIIEAAREDVGKTQSIVDELKAAIPGEPAQKKPGVPALASSPMESRGGNRRAPR